MGTLIAWVISMGVPQKIAKPLIFVIGLIMAAGLLFGLKSCYDNSVVEKARVEGNAKVQTNTNAANEKSSDQRATDTARQQIEQQEVKEAIEDAKANGRDPRAAYYECIRLQQQARKAGRPAPAC